MFSTYGHRQLNIGHPVRSGIHKQLTARLVLRWVTTWESLVLYVLHHLFAEQSLTMESKIQLEPDWRILSVCPVRYPYLVVE